MANIKNSDSAKIKALIKKVKVLSERGEGGERETAKIKLKELTDKYQIKKLDESKNVKRDFRLVDFNDCKTIMTHCILDTKPTAKISGNEKKQELYCTLTDVEYIEVCEKFNHYYPEFYKQKELLLKAFIIKNDLGIIDEESVSQNNQCYHDIHELAQATRGVSRNRLTKGSGQYLETLK